MGDCFTERCESMPDGELISVTINDGIKKFSELGRHDNSNDDKSKYKKVCAGDIAYNSMRMWQGASGCSPYEGIVSPAYTVLTPNSGINSKCMAYQFKLPATIHTFKINSQGITSDNWNLKFPALSEIEIYVSPYEQEQAKIAAYFANLDHLITLHQRKYDKLQVLKKAMLEKMFPKNGSSVPEIRFKGFTDAWEQRKLGELVEIGDIDHRMPETVADGIPYLMTGDFCGTNELNFNSVKMISENDYRQLSQKIKPEQGDIIFARYASVGAARYVDFTRKFLISYSCAIIKQSKKIDSKYLYHFITSASAQKQIKIEINTGSQANIGIDSMKNNIIVDMPLPEEQRKIGIFLTQIDHLITLHQRELEKLQNIKKSMLEKMFV